MIDYIITALIVFGISYIMGLSIGYWKFMEGVFLIVFAVMLFYWMYFNPSQLSESTYPGWKGVSLAIISIPGWHYGIKHGKKLREKFHKN